MNDFPEWMRAALRVRFDQHSLQSLNDPRLKELRERTQASTERLLQQVGDSLKGDLLLWEEEIYSMFSQEVEGAYMQRVCDGAELLLSLMCRERGLENV